jgi:hypothetical protein
MIGRNIDPCLWRTLFDGLAEVFKHNDVTESYVVDSLPVAVCDNIRIRRSRSSIPQKNMAKPSVTISSANAATSTGCGCIWWCAAEASRWSSHWRLLRKPM